LDSSSTRPR